MLIDGYNLLNSRAFLAPRQLDLEGQREHLLRLLHSYASRHRVQITVVFDNAEQMPQSRRVAHSLEAIFCRPGQEADEYIRRRIREEKAPGDLTVVSSDRVIRFTARDHGVTCLRSEEFCRLLRADELTASEPEEEDPHPPKYDPNLSESEIEFWKRMFQQDADDE